METEELQELIDESEKLFKSYYVVWKPFFLFSCVVFSFCLNRTM